MKPRNPPDVRRRTAIAMLLLAGLAAAPAFAQQTVSGRAVAAPAAAIPELGPEWNAMGPFQLTELRGGFDLPSGMKLSFGIERVVHVNGELLAQTRFHVADLGRLTPQQAAALADATRPLVVQVGAGNTFDPASMSGGVNGLVIQNTLDGQDIRALTTINVSVDTLEMFKQLNANETLQNALLGSR